MIKFTKILFSISFLINVSCANLREYKEPDFQPIDDVRKIEGEYDNVPFNIKNQSYATFNNVIDWRKKKSDTIKFSSVSLKVLNDKLIQFNFANKTGNIKSVTAKYKVKKDGFVSLKNSNFKLTGLPYIFGGYELNKVEIGLTNSNQLILNGTKIDEGAILIILPASFPKTNYTYKFERK